ncbi:unnamed protein product [Calypogeia fissa]
MDPDRGEHIQRGNSDETLVAILGELYFGDRFRDMVVTTLDRHTEVINNEDISQSLNSGVKIPHLVEARVEDRRLQLRSKFQVLVCLLNAENEEGARDDWMQQAHEHAKKIMIKSFCQGTFDDDSCSRLLLLPQTTNAACQVLESIFCCLFRFSKTGYSGGGYMQQYTYIDSKSSFSSIHKADSTDVETLRALLTLYFEKFISTGDAIVKVGEKIRELLAMDPSLCVQFAIVKFLSYFSRVSIVAIRALTEFPGLLDFLLELLVSANNEEVRACAGEIFICFSGDRLFASKIVAIPRALERLAHLFFSGDPLQRVPCQAKLILVALSSILKNKVPFAEIEGFSEGLVQILANIKVAWQATSDHKERNILEARAYAAATILSNLALDKELKEAIKPPLPGVEEGLRFLQNIEMSSVSAAFLSRKALHPIQSTRALTILYSDRLDEILTDLPGTVLELTSHHESDPSPSTLKSLVGAVYFSVYWTRLGAFLDMGAHRQAIASLDLADQYLDELLNLDLGHDPCLAIPVPHDHNLYYSQQATVLLRDWRKFLQGMLKDSGGTLKSLEEYMHGYKHILVKRGVLRKLSGDSQAALPDLKLVFNVAMKENVDAAMKASIVHDSDAYVAWKLRCYVKYLTGKGAKRKT